MRAVHASGLPGRERLAGAGAALCRLLLVGVEVLLGAAGAVEAIFSILAIRDGRPPPTINLDNPDPACDLDYVPHTAREVPLTVALSNSFGFGGTNGSLVFRALR